MIYIYAFVVIFNSTLRIEIPYPTMQDCYMTHVMVENDPSRLYYNPTDYGRKECHDYWKNKRR